LENGLSSHHRELAGNETFWSVQLFVDELNNLLAHLDLQARPIDVLGHSWGGMLAAVWAATSPKSANLRRLILSSSLASMEAWRKGVQALREQLPPEVQKVLDEAEETKDFDSPAYQDAVKLFYKRHLSLARPWPAPEVQAALNWFANDSTTYGIM
jgi:proline-specific peptidase